MAASTATVRASGWTACAAWADRRGEQQRETRPGIVAEQQRWVIGTADLVQRWIEHKLEGEVMRLRRLQKQSMALGLTTAS
ncbi:hypothetical protein M0R45_020263 [Rubus argutus]|uniref:Uncharacterized protein n=1 Tax=Rubus argutus TaxID=59490 RepID=A0AAW1X8E1_RUBAR